MEPQTIRLGSDEKQGKTNPQGGAQAKKIRTTSEKKLSKPEVYAIEVRDHAHSEGDYTNEKIEQEKHAVRDHAHSEGDYTLTKIIKMHYFVRDHAHSEGDYTIAQRDVLKRRVRDHAHSEGDYTERLHEEYAL